MVFKLCFYVLVFEEFVGSGRTHTWSVLFADYLHGIDEAYEDHLDDKVRANYAFTFQCLRSRLT